MQKVSEVIVRSVVLAGGVFKSEHVLRYGDVQTLGRAAVNARGSEGILDADEWRRQGVEGFRSSTLTHKRVLTTGGRDLGEIDERHTRSRLARGDGITIGADAVLVPEEIAAPVGGTSRQR